MFPDCISLSHESDIFLPSPFLKRWQMGSEAISGRCLRSLNCTLACLCIPRRDVTIIGPNGNRCRVRQDAASAARRAACQASAFAADRLQRFIRSRFTARNSLAETLSEIASWQSRQRATLSSACSRTRITFVESSDISVLKITFERPAGARKSFSDECKNSGCKCLGDGERCHAKPECCHRNCNWKSSCSQV